MPEHDEQTIKRYEADKLIEKRLERFADRELKQAIDLALAVQLGDLVKRLDRVEQVVSMVKWLAAAVGLLLIGTIYQALVGVVGSK